MTDEHKKDPVAVAIGFVEDGAAEGIETQLFAFARAINKLNKAAVVDKHGWFEGSDTRQSKNLDIKMVRSEYQRMHEAFEKAIHSKVVPDWAVTENGGPPPASSMWKSLLECLTTDAPQLGGSDE